MSIISETEAKYLVTPEVKEYIQKKYKDENPLIKVYIAAHSGETVSNVVGEGKTKIRWLDSAIKKIENFINVPLYIGHGKSNRNKPLGETVAAGTISKNDKIYSYILSYFTKENRTIAKTLDVVSLEVDALFDRVTQTVKDINNVFAAALGNSKTDQPAFQEAFAQATVENFENFLILNYELETEIQNNTQDKNMNLKEIKMLVNENNWGVDDIFTPDKIKQTSLINDLVNEQINKQKEQFEKQIQSLQVEAAQVKFENKFSEILADKETPETLKGFLTAKKSQYKFNEDFDKSFTEFVNTVKSEHDQLKEIGLISDKKAPPEKKIIPSPAQDKEERKPGSKYYD